MTTKTRRPRRNPAGLAKKVSARSGRDVPFDVAVALEQMSPSFANRLHKRIVAGFARTLFINVWADDAEQSGVSLRGHIEDLAPKRTPMSATLAAERTFHKMEGANNCPIEGIFVRAILADGKESDPEDFGSDLAMMAMGTGVSWFDDHKEFPLRVPRVDYTL